MARAERSAASTDGPGAALRFGQDEGLARGSENQQLRNTGPDVLDEVKDEGEEQMGMF